MQTCPLQHQEPRGSRLGHSPRAKDWRNTDRGGYSALRERLERLERTADFDEARYEKLKAIAKDCRKHMKEPYLSIEHGDLLYDERGLPK